MNIIVNTDFNMFFHLAERGAYLTKNTSSASTPTANPHKEITLNFEEQASLCWYLSTELLEHFTEQAVDYFIINWIQKCGSCFINPQAAATLNKLTMSTDLAMQAEATKPKKTLPPEYTEFAQVFSKAAKDHVSPSQPYDHAINLDESFIPKIGKLYPLSVAKHQAADDFIDENLHSGKIWPSTSHKPLYFSL